jgi:hypothetical protein
MKETAPTEAVGCTIDAGQEAKTEILVNIDPELLFGQLPEMGQQDHVHALGQWAEWGKTYVPVPTSRADWSAVEVLIEAAQPRLLGDSKALRELLDRSTNRFKLTDPLLIDLGVHRWLAMDREASWSDWLAWVLERLADATMVLRVLGVQNPKFVSACAGQSYRVEREAQVKAGVPGSEGQIDLLVHLGEPEVALLGVEVKTFDESYEKQRGYLRSLRKLSRHVECVLVANDHVPQNKLFGFRLWRWEDLSMALRRAIAWYVQVHGGDAVAAMMLGFVGAVEQNLLGYGSAAPRRAAEDRPTLLPKHLYDYLRQTLGGDS